MLPWYDRVSGIGRVTAKPLYGLALPGVAFPHGVQVVGGSNPLAPTRTEPAQSLAVRVFRFRRKVARMQSILEDF